MRLRSCSADDLVLAVGRQIREDALGNAKAKWSARLLHSRSRVLLAAFFLGLLHGFTCCLALASSWRFAAFSFGPSSTPRTKSALREHSTVIVHATSTELEGSGSFVSIDRIWQGWEVASIINVPAMAS